MPESVVRRSRFSARTDARALCSFDTGVVKPGEPKTCSLRLAAEQRVEVCPRERCSFWEPGGAVVEGNCLLERLGVDLTRPGLADYLFTHPPAFSIC